MEFYEKLRRLRKENGLSQEELAQQLNVSRQAVSKWESGQGYPETDKLLMISTLFGVSLDYLLKSDGSEAVLAGDEAGYYVSRETASGYLSMKKAGARRIALGVAVMVLSLAFEMLFEDALGTFLFMLGVAAGVAILVLQGFQPKRYEEIELQPLVFEADVLRELKTLHAAENRRSGLGIVAGVVLVIASYAVNVLIEDLLKLPAAYQAIYPILWASAVSLFIICGSAISASGVLANNREHLKEAARERKSGWIYVSGFLTATVVFIVAGLLWDLWHPAWVVYPATALLCTAIASWWNARA